jgi:hypothetical protein
VGDDDQSEVVTEFEADLNTAIRNKELQLALDEVNADSPVYVVTGLDSPTGIIGNDESTRESTGLSAGAAGGLAVVGLIGLICVSILLARGGRRQSEMYLKQNESVDIDEIQPPDEETSEERASLEKISPHAAPMPPPTMTSNTSAFDYDYGQREKTPGQTKKSRKTKKSGKTKQFEVPAAISSPPEKRSDDSSNAGSSGWSSHGGMSSLDDSSVDDENGPSLAEIGVTSSLRRSRSRGTEPGIQTYSELDDAIQKGDWAAVGVTAALLASQSYDTILSQSSDVSESKLPPKGSLNPHRAAELDRLVESGDWEGVVRAAAKYDAQESLTEQNVGSVSSRGGSSGRISGSGSVASAASSSGTGPSVFSGSGTGRSAFTSSGGTTASDTNSRAKKLDEIRTEIELLVQHVVPEEKDNIDEMMLQFRGREEELVETLRSMQERQVAQKARLEGQKRAKRDARATVETKYTEMPSQQLAVDNTGAPADENWMMEIDNTPADGANTTSSFGRLGIDQLEPPQEEDEDNETNEMQQKLREAIENENWDAVAETASGLSDRFVDDASIASSRDDSTSVSDRSQEINGLVDKGDWEGVVAAASRYNEADRSVDTSIEDRRVRRQRRLKEEEEALAQADIWNAIAEQTKSESTQGGK